MAGVRAKPLPNGKIQGWFKDSRGKRVFFVGTHSPAETRRIADRLEDEHRQVALGYRPAPKASDGARKRAFREVADEFLAWGKAQGGRRGLAWAPTHAYMRESFLDFWQERLGLVALGDVEGCLPRVEKVLRELQGQGRAGRTLNSYADGLGAFLSWCVERGLLDADPLKGLAAFEDTPRTARRCLTAEQAELLLATVDAEGGAWARQRRMGYALALCTGLRRRELQSLRVKHLDAAGARVRLEAAWTKNRRDGWQPVPRVLAAELAEDAARKSAEDGLVFVAREAADALEADLELAGMKRWGPGGKVDFHALRHSFVTFLHGAGASFEEARVLARHASQGITSTYLHVSEARLRELVEAVGRLVLPEAQAAGAVLKTGTDDEPATEVEPKTGRVCATGVQEGEGGIRKGKAETGFQKKAVRTRNPDGLY